MNFEIKAPQIQQKSFNAHALDVFLDNSIKINIFEKLKWKHIFFYFLSHMKLHEEEMEMPPFW